MQRKKWVDAARALAMIFVVFGHVSPNSTWAIIFTAPVKIPLFFILSGYLFNDHKGDTLSFTKNKLKKLVLPYFVLSIISGMLNAVMWIATGSDPVKVLKNVAESIIIGERLWFIPCLILCEFFMYFIIKCTRGKINLTLLVSTVFMALTLIFIKDGTKLPWGIDKVPVMTFVMIVGYYFRQREAYFSKFVNISATVISGILYIALILLGAKLTGMKIMDIHNSEYVGIFTIPQILLGCGFIVLLLHNIKIPGFLIYIGQNTLTYYAFHTFSMVILGKVSRVLLKTSLAESAVIGIAVTVITLLIMVIPSELINRFAPWMVGKKAVK